MASSINSFQPTSTTKESLRNGVTLPEKNESKRTKELYIDENRNSTFFSKAINFRDKSESKQINWQIRQKVPSILIIQLVDKSVSKQRSKNL